MAGAAKLGVSLTFQLETIWLIPLQISLIYLTIFIAVLAMFVGLFVCAEAFSVGFENSMYIGND